MYIFKIKILKSDLNTLPLLNTLKYMFNYVVKKEPPQNMFKYVDSKSMIKP